MKTKPKAVERTITYYPEAVVLKGTCNMHDEKDGWKENGKLVLSSTDKDGLIKERRLTSCRQGRDRDDENDDKDEWKRKAFSTTKVRGRHWPQLAL